MFFACKLMSVVFAWKSSVNYAFSTTKRLSLIKKCRQLFLVHYAPGKKKCWYQNKISVCSIFKKLIGGTQLENCFDKIVHISEVFRLTLFIGKSRAVIGQKKANERASSIHNLLSCGRSSFLSAENGGRSFDESGLRADKLERERPWERLENLLLS